VAMRGADVMQEASSSFTNLDGFMPSDHPLRRTKALVDDSPRGLNAQLNEIYADKGRASIAPEKLLRALLLLQMSYSVRSQRVLMEQIGDNTLFRWFVGLAIDDAVWDHSVFSKKRDRLLEHQVIEAYLAEVKKRADAAALLSKEHFSFDGTLIQAWARHKCFKARIGDDGQTYGDGPGRNAQAATAFAMLPTMPKQPNGTVSADKAYATGDFGAGCRTRRVTPLVAQNDTHRHSAIDAQTTRHADCGGCQLIRKRIEEYLGWGKTVGRLRQTVYRGIERVDHHFTLTISASHPIRMGRMLDAVPSGAAR
jgi:transposase